MVSTSQITIQREAAALSRLFDAVGAVDPELADLALDGLGDAQLTVTWLALPLDELGGRSPMAAWASGDRVIVADLIKLNQLR